MDIEIRLTPYSQSALVQLVLTGEFDLKQNEVTYPRGIYYYWYHDIYVTITENSFAPHTGKQKLFFRSKLKPDGTDSINTIFDFPVYPLHSATEYRIDVRMVLTHTDNTTEEFTAGANFSTQIPITEGVVKDRYTEELTLKEKQINAIYLYNKLVRNKRYALEAFCCLLGISEVAGDLNPASFMIYKGFEESQPEDYSDYLTTDAWATFGLFEWDYPPLPYGGGELAARDYRLYVPQNGINSQYVDYYGAFGTYIPQTGRSFPQLYTNWFYFNTFTYKDTIGLYPSNQYPEDYKKQIAFGIFPFQKIYGKSYFLNSNPISNTNKQAWLTIEALPDVYKRLQQTPAAGMWYLSAEHQEEYSTLWSKYNTFTKFTLCRNPAVKKIAEFMCYCFIDSSTNWGTLGVDTAWYNPEQHWVLRLYEIDKVKERAEYWYKFFKKRRHPWWVYIKWNL